MFNLLPASKAPHLTTKWDGVHATIYLTKGIILMLKSKNFNDYFSVIYILLFNDIKLKTLVNKYINHHSVSMEVKDEDRFIGSRYDNLGLDYSEGLLFQLIKLRALIDVIKVGFRDFTTK